MREIKFRGKPIESVYEDWTGECLFSKDEFVYGNLIRSDKECYIAGGDFIEASEDGISLEWWVAVDPVTVGQFLGLQDKHGQDIYEGDILRYTKIVYTDCSQSEIEEVLEPGLIELIQHRPLAAIVKPLTGNVRAFAWDCETREGLLIDLTSQEVEIVGNIHDNPELVERSGKAQLSD